MANRLHFGAIVAGTTTILSAQLFGCLNSFPVLPFGHSGDLGFRLAVFSNLPANAQSNPQNIPLANKDLIFSQTTKARISFIPPADKNSRSSQGSGARGCQQSLPVNLVTLLIPSKDYIGQTTSGHPTFFWHLSQPISVPLRFTLVEPGVAKPLFVKQIDSPQVGTMQLALPKDRPELVAGRSYGWSVSLICNSRRPSANPYFYSWIERVPTTPVLEQQLAAATSSSNSPGQTPSFGEASSQRSSSPEMLRASIYARSGVWYDTLAAISTAQAAKPRDPFVQEDFLTLLDQVGLAEVANQERQRLAKN